MYRRGKLQAMKVEFECSPEAVARLKCLAILFNEFQFETDQIIEYIVESEHQDGPGYWAKHFLVDGEINRNRLIEDVETYLEVTNANTGLLQSQRVEAHCG